MFHSCIHHDLSSYLQGKSLYRKTQTLTMCFVLISVPDVNTDFTATNPKMECNFYVVLTKNQIFQHQIIL
ncbi:hypothetical protein RUM44_002335 [Polyplax serrata]|uniref:Uncharacterized protein n=1 Tax=Polyplax serrata TaxID=468196 RepID=A0ABR1AMK0_POLSC